MAAKHVIAEPMPAEQMPAEPMRAGPMPAEPRPDAVPGPPVPDETAAAAEQIGLAVLALAKAANCAGLTTLGFLLESAALEAGAEAAAHRGPADTADP